MTNTTLKSIIISVGYKDMTDTTLNLLISL